MSESCCHRSHSLTHSLTQCCSVLLSERSLVGCFVVWPHSLTHSLTHSLSSRVRRCSFVVRSFVPSFLRSFVGVLCCSLSFIPSFVRSFVRCRSFVVVRSFVWFFVALFVVWLFVALSVGWVVVRVLAVVRLMHSFTHSPIRSSVGVRYLLVVRCRGCCHWLLSFVGCCGWYWCSGVASVVVVLLLVVAAVSGCFCGLC